MCSTCDRACREEGRERLGRECGGARSLGHSLGRSLEVGWGMREREGGMRERGEVRAAPSRSSTSAKLPCTSKAHHLCGSRLAHVIDPAHQGLWHAHCTWHMHGPRGATMRPSHHCMACLSKRRSLRASAATSRQTGQDIQTDERHRADTCVVWLARSASRHAVRLRSDERHTCWGHPFGHIFVWRSQSAVDSRSARVTRALPRTHRGGASASRRDTRLAIWSSILHTPEGVGCHM